ncbi:MAG: tyrosine-type recombinase/integrase [Eubacteriales bacterium]|nr:tyrosine-type recombinase/integrase [Eubacteriales bacterium]
MILYLGRKTEITTEMMTEMEREMTITQAQLKEFEGQLIAEEKSELTTEKYMRDVRRFAEYVGNRPLSKEMVIMYKGMLQEEDYRPGSINSMLVSVNRFLTGIGNGEMRIKHLKLQSRPYVSAEKELKRHEYIRLLKAAERNPRLQLIIETICSTGIRVSELKYFTVSGVRTGEIEVSCKGKIRVIIIPGRLRRKLIRYCSSNGIREGIIFRTRYGNPINRSNIWAELKRLGRAAGIDSGKVYPHNLRKLFAKCFYRVKRDLSKLADVLGHASINTTRIYIMETSREHRRIVDGLGLVL